MDTSNTTTAFAALSQQTRLDIFRLLIKSGADGKLSGEIGKILNVKQNTMSANLSILLNANLVKNQRQGRAIRYYANFEALRGLLSFLMEDCCGGTPEICTPIIEAIACDC
ncbi:MAG: winged helix-turn-helix transcriptional regulator [Alphaproteobacteria bacterium]|nr:winged helix-turn-helix transcriptional regulator [Alphaproteobacteria bacterium]